MSEHKPVVFRPEQVLEEDTLSCPVHVHLLDAIRSAWWVLREEWWTLIIISAVPGILKWVLRQIVGVARFPGAFLFHGYLARNDWLVASRDFLLTGAWIVIASWFAGALALLVHGSLTGEDHRLTTVLRPRWRALGRLALCGLAIGVSSWGALALAKITGSLVVFLSMDWVFQAVAFVVGIRLVLVPFAIIVEGKGIIGALRYSFKLTGYNFFRILMIEVAIALPILGFWSLLSLGISELYTDLGHDWVWWVNNLRVIPNLMTIFTGAARWAAWGAIYADRRSYLFGQPYPPTART